MKRLFAVFFAFVAMNILLVTAAAETSAAEAAAPLSLMERALISGKLLGFFILVMAIIYILLLGTKKIAAWVDKHKT